MCLVGMEKKTERNIYSTKRFHKLEVECKLKTNFAEQIIPQSPEVSAFNSVVE